jgi:hypothetical protein
MIFLNRVLNVLPVINNNVQLLFTATINDALRVLDPHGSQRVHTYVESLRR